MLKYYIIFNKESKLIAFSKDKELLKLFIKKRKIKKFKLIKLKDIDINNKLKNNLENNFKELMYHTIPDTGEKLPLTAEEENEIIDLLTEQGATIEINLYKFSKMIDTLVLNSKEKEYVHQAINKIVNIIDDIKYQEEFDEDLFDFKKIIDTFIKK